MMMITISGGLSSDPNIDTLWEGQKSSFSLPQKANKKGVKSNTIHKHSKRKQNINKQHPNVKSLH
jgi:hypothetical protein